MPSCRAGLVFCTTSLPQQEKERWIGQIWLRRSLMTFLLGVIKAVRLVTACEECRILRTVFPCIVEMMDGRLDGKLAVLGRSSAPKNLAPHDHLRSPRQISTEVVGIVA